MSDKICKFQGLQSLEVDFTNACYPVGSCRELGMKWDKALVHTTKTRCVGRNNNESMEIMECFGDLMDEYSELEDEEIEARYDWSFEFQTLNEGEEFA
jgi:hypothetical protein